jgi:hypothetical protein
MKRLIFRIAASLLIAGGILSCSGLNRASSHQDALLAGSPAYTSYLIENEWIQLENGRAEWRAAPGSFSRIKIALLGEPVYGDLTGDAMEDAVLFLTYQGGGSGTFYYIGAALSENSGYRGTNTILLGDRISRPVAYVQNGVITVIYLGRRPEEPMVTFPSLEQTRYFIAAGSVLREITPSAGEALYQGWLTVGHEVRSFLPCDEREYLWILGNSPALDPIIAAYGKTMAGAPPYTPVFAIMSGRRTSVPEEGYGTDYQEAFRASVLIHLWPRGNCRSNFIMVDTPLPGARISSPLTLKGKARGTWFFEGDFPVILLDARGNRIAESYAAAKGEWMTDNFVGFEGMIHFKGFSGTRGILILKKDNPTGLPQFDDSLEIPINFK